MPKHYIAMSGSYGCLPDRSEVYDNYFDAIGDLKELFELDGAQHVLLKARHYIDLPAGSGADYAEIVHCDCDNPAIHSDG